MKLSSAQYIFLKRFVNVFKRFERRRRSGPNENVLGLFNEDEDVADLTKTFCKRSVKTKT